MNWALVQALFCLFTYYSSTAYAEGKQDAGVQLVVIEKNNRIMRLYDSSGKVLRKYYVSLGSSPTGPKMQEGDGKTPEGSYAILSKNPNSRFHKSLKISYPNSHDRKMATQRNVAPGGDIMIHGIGKLGFIGSFHRLSDWTQGCIAVTNDEIDEIYSDVAVGTKVIIKP